MSYGLDGIEQLRQGHASGRRRRHGKEPVAPVRARKRGALHGLVGSKVFHRDPSAAARHLCGDQFSGLAFVEPGPAPVPDSPEDLRKVLLHKAFTRFIALTRVGFREVLRGAFELRKGVALRIQSRRIPPAQQESFLRKANRRSHHLRQWEATIFFVRHDQPCRRTRHARGKVSQPAQLGNGLPLVVEIHVPVGCGGRLLAIVDGSYFRGGRFLAFVPVRKTDHHKTAAADVPRRRIRNRQRKPGGHCRIHCIAALLEYLHTGFGSLDLRGNDHAAPCFDRCSDPFNRGDRYGRARTSGDPQEGRSQHCCKQAFLHAEAERLKRRHGPVTVHRVRSVWRDGANIKIL